MMKDGTLKQSLTLWDCGHFPASFSVSRLLVGDSDEQVMKLAIVIK